MNTPLFADVFAAIQAGEKKIKINGLWGSSEALFLARCLQEGIPFCLVTPSWPQAQQMHDEIRFFLSCQQGTADIGDMPLALFSPLDLLPGESAGARPDEMAARLAILHPLAAGKGMSLVVPVEAFLQPVLDKSFLLEQSKTVKSGEILERDLLIEELHQRAYERVETVTQPGEFAVRGGILDLYSPLHPHPVRLEFFGDAPLLLRAFDPASQRSLEPVDAVLIIPCRETIAEAPQVPLSTYLPSSMALVYDEPDAVSLQVKRLGERENVGSEGFEKDLLRAGEKRVVIDLESLSIGSARDARRFSFDLPSPATLGIGHFGFSEVIQRLGVLRSDHLIVLVVGNAIAADRFKRLFNDYDTPWSLMEAGWSSLARPAPVLFAMGKIAEGFLLPDENILFLTDAALAGQTDKKRLPREPSDHHSLLLGSFEELRPNDYVVHVEHGVGQYTGLKRIAVALGWRGDEKYEADFLCLRYAGGNTLYVPLSSLKLVSRYIGPEGGSPALDTLGGTRWAKTKAKVKKFIQEMTGELLTLYAQRQVVEGHAFTLTPHLDEFAAGFEYEETPDQLRAIEAVVEDMQGRKPMDRLICGDVGYGKTEVAMRGAFLAVMDNKQVAVIVPTTLLASQHGATFAKRFEPFPVKVAVLSRLSSRKEQTKILAEIKHGGVDIVIGTHRLFQKDVVFANLGLLVVDEEHRFGVRHKERLKQLRKEVDVLTLTATPIPRTLQMALAAARDMTVLESPPVNRLSIRTQLAAFDPKLIREVIFRELARGGQVFFVHNRVHDIETIGTFLTELVPEAKICIAHGQMREGMLESVMMGFISKKYNVLVTTTIIESGLDIPSANTIIIHNADRFGLAELYQLRGRVGRSDVQAYAYLLVQEEKILTEEARKRLKTIVEFTELGDGFRIAARDLEIRGAGNLLGSEQSGKIAEVGFDLYLKMIDETVREMKGTHVEKEIDPELQLKYSSYIPEEYVSDAYQRLMLYRRLSTIRTLGEVDTLHEEMVDRYGLMPHPVTNLLNIVKLKRRAVACRVRKIVQEEHKIVFSLDESASVDEQALNRLLGLYTDRIRFQSPFSFSLEAVATVTDIQKKTRAQTLANADEETLVEISRCLAALQGEKK